MIKLQHQIIKEETYEFERNDLLRIQNVMFNEESLFLTLDECGNLWQNYSTSLCASWIYVPTKDNLIIPTIKSSSYFESIEKWIIEDDK